MGTTDGERVTCGSLAGTDCEGCFVLRTDKGPRCWYAPRDGGLTVAWDDCAAGAGHAGHCWRCGAELSFKDGKPNARRMVPETDLAHYKRALTWLALECARVACYWRPLSEAGEAPLRLRPHREMMKCTIAAALEATEEG